MRKSSTLLVFLTILTFIFSCVHDPITDPKEVAQPASNLLYIPNSLAVEFGKSDSSSQPVLEGTDPFAFNFESTPSDNGNITIDQKGIIHIANTLAIGEYKIEVSVINAAGTIKFPDALSVSVFSIPEAPSQLLYSPSSTTLLSGNAFASTAPDVQGTAPFTYSILENPAPNEISIDDDGVISSTDALSAGTYYLNIEVTNIAETVRFDSAFTIEVSDASLPPSALTYSVDNMTVVVGTVASSVTPSLMGTAPFNFSFFSSPNAANGLSIDNSGVITANVFLQEGVYNLSVVVSNSSGSDSFPDIYTVTVTPPPPVTFANDIRPLIQQRCGSCHTGGSQINFTNYSNASSNINTILNRVQRTPGATGFMPRNGTPLSAAQIQLFQDWLDDGLLP